MRLSRRQMFGRLAALAAGAVGLAAAPKVLNRSMGKLMLHANNYGMAATNSFWRSQRWDGPTRPLTLEMMEEAIRKIAVRPY